jgi:hypothetical protein
VFVNLWAEPRGQALAYPAVYDLVRRLRKRVGFDFDPHWCRHTMATRALRDGVPIEVVSKLLGHASLATTLEVYGNPRELHQTSEVCPDSRLCRPPECRPQRDTLSIVTSEYAGWAASNARSSRRKGKINN